MKPKRSATTTAFLLPLAVGLSVLSSALPAAAQAQPPAVVFAIGANGRAADGVIPLHYADDDAVEAAALYQGATRTFLHAQLDAESQRAFPDAAARAKPATLASISASIQAAKHDGVLDGATAVVWISGHGVRDADGHLSLLLDDGLLSAAALRARLLQPLAESAHRVFFVVDTCFAGGLVQGRAKVASATAKEVDDAFSLVTTSSLPNVATVFGASAQQQGFEWNAIGAGVFSAMLRAGLRGAADVDQDGQIRLKEIVAFGRAAGAEVRHLQARPSLRVVPAALEQDLIVMRPHWRGDDRPLSLAEGLASLSRVRTSESLGQVKAAGKKKSPATETGVRHVEVRDATGRWLASASLEKDFGPTLFLPAGAHLLINVDGDWFEVRSDDEQTLAPLAAPGFVARDAAADAALRNGLFRAAFGPAFFAGFQAAGGVPLLRPRSDVGQTPLPLASTTAFAIGGVAAFAAGALGIAAALNWIEFAATDLQVPAREALQRAAWWTSGATFTAMVATASVVAGVVFWPPAATKQSAPQGDVATLGE